MCVYISICILIYIYVYIYIYIHKYTCVMRVYMCVNIRFWIHIRTWIHVYSPLFPHKMCKTPPVAPWRLAAPYDLLSLYRPDVLTTVAARGAEDNLGWQPFFELLRIYARGIPLGNLYNNSVYEHPSTRTQVSVSSTQDTFRWWLFSRWICFGIPFIQLIYKYSLY